ncbi:hypothetical protein [Bacillus kexueae]|uniref:hypothetical protein n=1 Tax=Aeribacillus kexueae TaxID=2078952 RepID=UPI001FAF497E|nr:hypothetical protein [Bacillus kexueae]
MDKDALKDELKQTFQSMEKDIKHLVFMAKNHGVFNHIEVSRVENKLKENLKAIEYIMLTEQSKKAK